MSATDPGQPFDNAWLSLREPFDARARSRPLAQRLAAMLPDRDVRLLELGAGTGSLFRWLAPILRRPQHWLWLDNDAAHLRHGLRRTAAWGRSRGHTVDMDDAAARLTLHTRFGAWTIETRVQDLRRPWTFLPHDDAQAVVCSALLDLFSAFWLSEMLDALGSQPLYVAMNVTTRQWSNRQDRDDALVLGGYHQSQIGDASRRAPLGPFAPDAAAFLCHRRGLQLRTDRADWTIGPHDRAMLRRVLAFQAAGARAALPQHHTRIDAWQRRRLRDVAAGRLAMRIAHRDLLVTPSR